jgi:hypothetical protein
MANTDLLNTPLLWINKYLQSKLSESLGYVTPFFPPSPFNLDDLTEKWMVLNDVNTLQSAMELLVPGTDLLK